MLTVLAAIADAAAWADRNAYVVAWVALAAGERRRRGQHDTMAAGYHPLGDIESAFGGLKLHAEAAPLDDPTAPGRRCGNCWYRRVLPGRRRGYPKCLFPGSLGADEIDKVGPPRVTHGEASDCRAWWAGCVDHSYGDPRMSEDAARWVPGSGEEA